MNQATLEQALFDTQALRICPEDTPFWYTSGKLGPFYINTHFLYGSEAEANALLADIEEAAAGDRLRFPACIAEKTMAQYEKNATYRGVIDALVEAAKGLSFDVVSGGERRDFFFSLPVARLLHKPHVTIFKDLSAVYTSADFDQALPVAEAGLSGQRALHIADLVTEASSYFRAWMPALAEAGLGLSDTLVVVDRDQGGGTLLAERGVRLHALLRVNEALLENALQNGQISAAQKVMILTFLRDPDAFMQGFLQAHPDFLAGQIALGGKAEERARLCIEKGYDKTAR